MVHTAIVVQLGGALSVAEAVTRGPWEEEAIDKWSQAVKEEGMAGKTGSKVKQQTVRQQGVCRGGVKSTKSPMGRDKSSEAER